MPFSYFTYFTTLSLHKYTKKILLHHCMTSASGQNHSGQNHHTGLDMTHFNTTNESTTHCVISM